ncbi:Arc family DNA-binding protein [Candidatus Fukatsuia symbiotica]|uniref:Arc-like DNA binding domain-containing protein n=1 Tax=Candidatus Fukatsuia symbiotica TaxID=1878942 RepID=A0A2U8I4U0_9GAMM|nr:Arc family DNA-binding protein [Candidatus Fukatsuia symbiotica]AWK14171.1 hypothetical protein CCS41_06235 [Candidatus Fukatsuia symbiotica]MEA9446272.1 Arc family DNA-binding protein [Candidatus Fukatsuia symbiotica]
MSKFPSQLQDKFNLRLPHGMRDAIAELAKQNCRSMNSEIVQILHDAMVNSGIGISHKVAAGLDVQLTDEDTFLWVKHLQRPEHAPELETLGRVIKKMTEEIKKSQ